MISWYSYNDKNRDIKWLWHVIKLSVGWKVEGMLKEVIAEEKIVVGYWRRPKSTESEMAEANRIKWCNGFFSEQKQTSICSKIPMNSILPFYQWKMWESIKIYKHPNNTNGDGFHRPTVWKEAIHKPQVL